MMFYTQCHFKYKFSDSRSYLYKNIHPFVKPGFNPRLTLKAQLNAR